MPGGCETWARVTCRDTPVLEARGITKVFPGTTALAGVDLGLERGCVRALIGENGAGKSTLVSILAGVEQPTSGELLLDGALTRFASARDAIDRGIGIIHQELQLFPDLTVAENLFVGRERCTRWATLDRRSEVDATRQVLAKLGQPIDPHTRLGTLPLGQQQIVEIARALVRDVRVLMMDEPTSALSAAEIPVLFRVIRDLASHGVSIVYISHRLEELLRIADSVTVLRDGVVVGEAPTSEVDIRWLVDRMTGGQAIAPRARPVGGSGAALLSLRDIHVPARAGRNVVDGVSFDVAAGEIVGLYGLMGAGRTELLEAVLGVHDDATGGVQLNGEAVESQAVSERVAAGIALVPEDRKASGFVAHIVGRTEHDAVEPRRSVIERVPCAGSGAEGGQPLHRGVANQDGESGGRDGIAERRQSAKGRDCPGSDEPASRAADG